MQAYITGTFTLASIRDHYIISLFICIKILLLVIFTFFSKELKVLICTLYMYLHILRGGRGSTLILDFQDYFHFKEKIVIFFIIDERESYLSFQRVINVR